MNIFHLNFAFFLQKLKKEKKLKKIKQLKNIGIVLLLFVIIHDCFEFYIFIYLLVFKC